MCSTRCAPSPGRLVCVFGCGGDRDRGKRPIMGAIAAEKADVVIVTDDNPRSEDAGRDPRRDPGGGARRARDRRPRRGDPRRGPRASRRATCCVVAGKGHETGQIVGDRTLPFSDHDEVAGGDRGELAMSAAALDRGRDRRRDRRAGSARRLSAATGVSIDTRTLAAGRPVLRPQGRGHDGHDFVARRARQGRRGGGRGRGRARRSSPAPAARRRAGRARRHAPPRHRGARARTNATIVAVTGSVGKTGTKEALRLALSRGRADPRLGRLLQQPLGRAADARAHAARRRLRRVRDRHEPCRRDRAADRAWCARMWR